ncbi:hypothetical protein TURU_053874 [Turdus rufiventris]|nr:hypothetical protein TURU_053874 [Turdus rufiventris]
MLELVRAVRGLRETFRLRGAARPPVLLQCPEPAHDWLELLGPAFQTLSGAGPVELLPPGAEPGPGWVGAPAGSGNFVHLRIQGSLADDVITVSDVIKDSDVIVDSDVIASHRGSGITDDVIIPESDVSHDVTTPGDIITAGCGFIDDVTVSHDVTDDVTAESDFPRDLDDLTDDVITLHDITDDVITLHDITDDIIAPDSDIADDVTAWGEATPPLPGDNDVTEGNDITGDISTGVDDVIPVGRLLDDVTEDDDVTFPGPTDDVITGDDVTSSLLGDVTADLDGTWDELADDVTADDVTADDDITPFLPLDRPPSPDNDDVTDDVTDDITPGAEQPLLGPAPSSHDITDDVTAATPREGGAGPAPPGCPLLFVALLCLLLALLLLAGLCAVINAN